MTREELIEVMARAILQDFEDGADMSTHAVPERAASRHARAALTALEAAGVRLVPVKELEDLLAGPAAWLDRWAEHVGTCWGGDQCACGLTLARHELAGAREALAASPYALKEIEVFQELAKRQEPLGAEFEAAIGDPSTLYET